MAPAAQASWQTRLAQNESDLSAALSLCAARSDALFLQYNLELRGLKDHGKQNEATYALVYSGAKCVAVVSHCWNKKVLLSAYHEVPAQILSEAVALAVKKSSSTRDVDGFIGEPEIIDRTLEFLNLDKENTNTSKNEIMLRLHLRDLPKNEDFSGVRRAELKDIEILTEWRVSFNYESLNSRNVNVEEERKELHESIEKLNVWLLEIHGTPVSTAAVNARTQEKIMLGAVYTPTELRRRGYATKVIKGLLATLMKEHPGLEQALLFTSTVAALNVYESIGFERIGTYRLHFFTHAIPIAFFDGTHAESHTHPNKLTH